MRLAVVELQAAVFLFYWLVYILIALFFEESRQSIAPSTSGALTLTNI